MMMLILHVDIPKTHVHYNCTGEGPKTDNWTHKSTDNLFLQYQYYYACDEIQNLCFYCTVLHVRHFY